MPIDPVQLQKLRDIDIELSGWKRELEVIFHSIVNIEDAGVDVTLTADVAMQTEPTVSIEVLMPEKVSS